jgi:hypothetical protein
VTPARNSWAWDAFVRKIALHPVETLAVASPAAYDNPAPRIDPLRAFQEDL